MLHMLEAADILPNSHDHEEGSQDPVLSCGIYQAVKRKASHEEQEACPDIQCNEVEIFYRATFIHPVTNRKEFYTCKEKEKVTDRHCSSVCQCRLCIPMSLWGKFVTSSHLVPGQNAIN
jgi:hypothetical protein